MSDSQEPYATENLLDRVTEIVCAYVSNNPVAMMDLPRLIADTYQALRTVSKDEVEPAVEELKPAVPIKKSVTPDFIICLDDGKKFKSLKRHLKSLGMTPDEYRAKWGLSADYPMVASNYSATRSALAKTAGLGRRPEAAPVASPKRTSKAKVEA